jgi:NAD-dependent SIR2 family protein deacetylase
VRALRHAAGPTRTDPPAGRSRYGRRRRTAEPEVTPARGPDPSQVAAAAEVLADADAVIVTAGAGIGDHPGLPDLRGDAGFWRAYPPYAHLGLSFVQLANPGAFRRDTALAWGFYGHRRALSRRTQPHAGVAVLRELARFVFTSNVDGRFQAAGFEPGALVECHGTSWWEPCLDGCGAAPFPASAVDVEVEDTTMRARDPLPSCPSCGGLARPNVLLFGDRAWDDRRLAEQEGRLRTYLRGVAGSGLVVLEVGAGTTVPTVRWFGESLVSRVGATLVRINPHDDQVPRGQVAVRGGAAASLLALRTVLGR